MSEEIKKEGSLPAEEAENRTKPAAADAVSKPANKQQPVYFYLFILFAVALLIMSFSFIGSHRSNEELQGQKTSALQALQEAEDKNVELREQIAGLEQQLRDAQELTHLQEKALFENQLTQRAMSLLSAIESEYRSGNAENAKALLLYFESLRFSDKPLTDYLPKTAADAPEGMTPVSPAKEYETIKNALFPDGLVDPTEKQNGDEN